MVKSSVSRSSSSSQRNGAETVASGRARTEHAEAIVPPRAFDLARERKGAAAHLAEAPLRLDPARDVHAAVARRLGPTDESELVECLLHDRGDLLGHGEAGAKLGIAVDAELVRVLDVAPPRRPGMEVDRREIRGPR